MHADKVDNAVKKVHTIDLLGLTSIGLISVCYILFSSQFAELNIQLPFLNFPVFIGEILLFVCLVLFTVRYAMDPFKLNKWHYLLMGCVFFILVKTWIGYNRYGPLAMRDAALLYYSLFAVFGYYFCRKDFFAGKKFFFIGPLFILAFIKIISESYVIYWSFSTVLLAGIFIMAYPDKRTRNLLWVLFLISIPYTRFFLTSRMMIVGNTVAVLYLIWAFFQILRFRNNIKIALSILSLLLFIAGMLTLSDSARAKTIISFKEVLATFREKDRIVQGEIGNFKMTEIKKPELYQPEERLSTRDYEEKLKAFQAQREQQELARMSRERALAQQRQPALELPTSATDNTSSVEPIPTPEKESVVPYPRQKDIEAVTVQEVVAVPEAVRSTPMSDDAVLSKPASVQEQTPVESITSQSQKSVAQAQEPIKPYQVSTGMNNAVFRLFIWRDMLVELAKEKPVFGFDFGKPLRSISLEILGWGWSNWGGQGWMPAHNSYLNIIYRAGIVGVLFLLTVFVGLFNMIREFIRSRSVIGILLCGVLINWFVAANFLMVLELPYTAIPIWSLYGITFAYCYKKEASEDELAKQKNSRHRG